MADRDPDELLDDLGLSFSELQAIQQAQKGRSWSEEEKEVARKFLKDPATRDDARDNLIRSQKSLISSDIKRLPSTDEVQEVLFKIQDLLVPFLAEEDEAEYEGDPSSGHLSRAGQIEALAKERRLKYGPDELS